MYHKTVLPNGLKIVTNPMKERDSVSIGLWVGSGGRYEDDRIKGVAHFLEHILFKGSQKYSCEEIKEKIEGVGGSLNAFTTEEQTCYYAKILTKHIRKTFDILSDMVFFPLIPKQEVEKERTVILEEIKMYRDLPQYYVMELLDSMMWPNHPLGKSLAGTAESVSRMIPADLREFHQRHYIPPNTVIAACGNIDHQSLVSMVKRSLRKISIGDRVEFFKVKDAQATARFQYFYKETEQMHMALGMPGIPEEHKDKYVLSMLHVILGGNMSSRLFDEIREKRGLAYSIASCVKSLSDTGMFMVRAGVHNNKITEATELILKELSKIKNQGVTKDELTRAKDYYIGQVLLGLEDTLDHMLWIGESTMCQDQPRTLADVVKRVKKVTQSDVLRVANELIVPHHYNLAIVGPVKTQQKQDLQRLLKIKK